MYIIEDIAASEYTHDPYNHVGRSIARPIVDAIADDAERQGYGADCVYDQLDALMEFEEYDFAETWRFAR